VQTKYFECLLIMNDAQKTSDASTEVMDEPEAVTFARFLEEVPPSHERKVTDLTTRGPINSGGGKVVWALATPELQLHCDICNGPRFFRVTGSERIIGKASLNYLTYRCDNCKRSAKTFSLYIFPKRGTCYKVGEIPPYGPPTPNRLLKLFEDERETFLKGRRCENQGLGIGAFAYYRRVVENQNNRILDEIIRVCKKIGASGGVIKVLEDAKKENQFSKAMASVKDAIPQVLLINGNNPLTLLHSALSGGIHAQTDEECLEFAHDARLVLIELAERLSQALKDEAELNAAITRLKNARQDK
jgi:hypothetical protein